MMTVTVTGSGRSYEFNSIALTAYGCILIYNSCFRPLPWHRVCLFCSSSWNHRHAVTTQRQPQQRQ